MSYDWVEVDAEVTDLERELKFEFVKFITMIVLIVVIAIFCIYALYVSLV